ncbi:MAG: helix-turn-helix domain-containing protein [Gammaproteobacteria bacterium]|nr:helix-turn-helix domain-containing protein [Gammaproteobacteria bacterium]
MATRKAQQWRTIRLGIRKRRKLEALLKGRAASPRERVRAQILLHSDKGWDRATIASAAGSSVSTVGRVRRSYCEEGLEAALSERPRPGGPRKLTVSQEQAIVALVCSDPPGGFSRWSIRLLTEVVHERGLVDDPVSRERIRVVLRDHGLKPWREKNVVRSQAR